MDRVWLNSYDADVVKNLDYPKEVLPVLLQKNIEALAKGNDAEIRRQVRITVMHEIGHYFGLDEDQLAALEDEPDAAPPRLEKGSDRTAHSGGQN